MTKSRTLPTIGALAVLTLAVLLLWPYQERLRDGASSPSESGDTPGLKATGPSSKATPSQPADTKDAAHDEPSPPRIAVTGRVVDTRLAPISQGEVQVHAVRFGRRRLIERATVNEKGLFYLSDDALGHVLVTYSGPRHYSENTMSLCRARHIELVAAPLHALRVGVVDRRGLAVPGVRVDGNRRRAVGTAGEALTDENGECELVASRGAFNVLARARDGRYGVALVRLPGTERVQITLDRQLVDARIRVTAAPGSEQLAGQKVVLTPCHGIIPIRDVESVVGGPPVMVPLKHVDVRIGAAGAKGERLLQSLGTLLARIGSGDAFRVPLYRTQLQKAQSDDVLVLRVEARRHEVTLHLRDAGGNPVRGYKFQLSRVMPHSESEALHIPLRPIDVESDHEGTATIRCASGKYEGPFVGKLNVQSSFDEKLVVNVTTTYGTAEPGRGYVRVVPARGANRKPYATVPIRDGKWYANLKNVPPGTTLTAEWAGTWASLAASDVVAGGAPCHLEVDLVSRNPHRSKMQISSGPRLIWCRLRLDTKHAHEPRVQHDVAGLRTFDLSMLPPGDYFVDVVTDKKLQYFFKNAVRVGDGELIEVDVQQADSIWDREEGKWLKR